MTTTPNEPISDGDAPSGDPDLAPHEQPDPATKSKVSPDHESDQDTEDRVNHDPDAEPGQMPESTNPEVGA